LRGRGAQQLAKGEGFKEEDAGESVAIISLRKRRAADLKEL